MIPAVIAIVYFLLFILLALLGISNGLVTWEIIFEKWVPAAITPASAGLFLALLVPWVNHLYWNRRTQKERDWANEKLKREIISDTAEILDGTMLHISRIAELNDEKANADSERKSEILKEIDSIHKAKLEYEMKIAKISRLIMLYFNYSLYELIKEWIEKYNELRKIAKSINPSDEIVSMAQNLLSEMRKEV